MDDSDALEQSLKRRGKMFAVVEIVLGGAAFGLAWLLYQGGVSWGALSEHSVYFAAGAAALGAIFVLGGLRRLTASS